MICFNQHMSSPRKSDVQPADTSKESKILITLFFFPSAILNNQKLWACAFG